eukprot:485620-Hanusia_phi.AAC.2
MQQGDVIRSGREGGPSGRERKEGRGGMEECGGTRRGFEEKEKQGRARRRGEGRAGDAVVGGSPDRIPVMATQYTSNLPGCRHRSMSSCWSRAGRYLPAGVGSSSREERRSDRERCR